MQRKHRISAFILAIILAFSFIPTVITANAAETGKVVYVSETGNDTASGSSASSPLKTLKGAFAALGSSGGTIVISGKVEVSEATTTCTGSVTITSVYNNVDYRTKSGASLTFYKNITMAGALKLENIKIITGTKSTTNFYPYNSISMKGFALHIGKGVDCALAGDCKTYLSIVGGSGHQQLTVESGHWQRVRGNDATGTSSTHAAATINISGGTFHEKLILTGEKSKRYVDVTATIDGGEFEGGIYLVAFEKDGSFGTTPDFTGNVNITVNGGRIYGPLSVSYRRLGSFYGNYTLNLNGGELHSITEICGPDAVGGTMLGTLNFGPDVNASATVKGSETFDFCLRDAADPFVFYHDGMYYFTSTGGTSIGISCAANLSDLGSAFKTTIFNAPSGFKNTWSPEIHHFTDEEVGFGNGGWYMFLGIADLNDMQEGETEASRQREYVLKCLDGDYLLGRWGHPLTGEVNKPLLISFEGDTDYNELFCAGMSILRIDGKVYMTFVSEVGRDTSNFHQTINITTLENPWTITGEPVVICKPDYDWEAHGYATDGNGKWWPKVVEGCSAVYGEDGSVYLMYTGSGYWTTWYALGYMKFVGTDPLKASSWQKNPTPILQRKSTLTANTVNGCGHGSYFTDAEGKMWVCYHGYIGKNTSSGRFAFLEPIYVSNSGVSIGGAGINPPDKGATQTEPLNSLPLSERASGFNTINEAPRFRSASLTLENNIAINFKVRNADAKGYTDLRAEFEMAGNTTKISEGTVEGDLLVFCFKNVSPAMMAETVTARLYATYCGTEYELDCREYSIAAYCYNQLATTTDSDSAFRTLLVDLLNYGAEAQLYTNRKTDMLATYALTDAQKAWATQKDPELRSCLSLSDAPETVKAKLISASLELQDNVKVQFKFSSDSKEGLTAKIKLGNKIHTVSADLFTFDNGVYVVNFTALTATQLSDTIEFTVYDGNTPVSKTVTYSVETYASNMQEGHEHSALVKALMKYGNAAKVYASK